MKRNRSRPGLLLAGLLLAVTMAMSVAEASAYDMSFNPAGPFTMTSSSLTFADGAGLITVVCPLTLRGDFDTGPISVARGRQFGTLTDSPPSSCRGGSVDVMFYPGSPWSMTVNTPLGTPPRANTGLLLDVIGATFRLDVRILGIPTICYYAGTPGALIGWLGPNPYTAGSSVTVLSNALSSTVGATRCPATIRLNGTFSLSPQQTITIT